MKPPVSYKIASDLYLVEQSLSSGEPKKIVDIPIHHIVIVDCSGSMSSDLPRIREQLKKKLPKLLQEKDVISVIWFSGRDQYGVLIEAEPVAALADLSAINGMIDRWLKPVCLTGFLQPIQEVPKLIDRCKKKCPSHASSLFFMSDGHDNCSVRADVLKAVEKAAGELSSATFVEYGYYADRRLLATMAEKASGTLIFSEDFDKYAPQFEAAIQKRPVGIKRVEIGIEGDVVGGFAFAMHDGDLLTFAIDAGKVQAPEGVPGVWSLSQTPIGKVVALGNDSFSAAYAAMSLFSVRMKPEIILPLLRVLGDVAFIERFGGLFGKQKYSEFMEEAKAAVFDSKKRLVKGYDPSKVPADDAFTVLDLLKLLSEDDGNRVLMEHSDFKYTAIGRRRIDVSYQLISEEQVEIEKLSLQIAAEKNAKKISELTDRIAAITSSKQSALKFQADPAPDGYAISNLTFNEDRPNISILVKKPGVVDLSDRLKGADYPQVSNLFRTFIYRNYAIVKDGLVNVKLLPVRVTKETYSKLVGAGVGDVHQRTPGTGDATVDMTIDVGALPVINRKMTSSVSAVNFFTAKYALTKAQAAQKVFNSLLKELFPPKKSESFAVLYGEASAVWLKEQGFTDYSGFSPKTVQADASDYYMGKELKVSLKGLSNLPSLKDLRTQIQKGKLNAGGKLMKPFLDKADAFLESDVYLKAANKDGVLKAWLEGEADAAKKDSRSLIYKIA